MVADFTLASRPTSCSTCNLGRLDVGYGPNAMVYDHADGRLIVTDSGPGGFAAWGVTMVNGTTDRAIGHFPTYVRPSDLTLDPRDGDIYVVGFLGVDNITVLNATNGTRVAVIELPPVGPYGGPFALTYDPVTGYADVLESNPSALLLVNVSTGAVVDVSNLSAGVSPVSPLVVNPDNGDIYLATSIFPGETFQLETLNGWNGTVVSSIPMIGTPVAFAFDDLNQQLYVSNGTAVVVVDAEGNQVLGSIAAGPYPLAIAVDSTDDEVYVVNSAASSNLTVINGTDDRTIGSVPIDGGPWALTYDDQNGCLYVLYGMGFPGTPDGYLLVIAPPGGTCVAPPSTGGSPSLNLVVAIMLTLPAVLLAVVLARYRSLQRS